MSLEEGRGWEGRGGEGRGGEERRGEGEGEGRGGEGRESRGGARGGMTVIHIILMAPYIHTKRVGNGVIIIMCADPRKIFH